MKDPNLESLALDIKAKVEQINDLLDQRKKAMAELDKLRQNCARTSLITQTNFVDIGGIGSLLKVEVWEKVEY